VKQSAGEEPLWRKRLCLGGNHIDRFS